jgi:hypothetical protein
VTDLCGVRWGDHACRYDNDGHLVGVDCECHCDQPDAGYPYSSDGEIDFAALTPPSLAFAAQRNYDHAIRFGVGG